MNTSYFSKYGNDIHAVSIAGYPPKFYKGREFKLLAPKKWFFEKYKKDGDEESYIQSYTKEVLNVLDPERVYTLLGENSILLCWEKPDKFCHRHLVAKWFNETIGKNVKEI